MKNTGKIDALVSQPRGTKDKWVKRLKPFTVHREQQLYWTGMKVPTIIEVEEVLRSVHIVDGKHKRVTAELTKTLKKAGFILPLFIGGSERAVNQ